MKWNGGWGINSPSRVRQPAAFYIWTVTGFFGAPGVLWAAILLAIGVGGLWYLVLYTTLGQRGLFVPIALFPLFAVHMSWYNLFQPDLWAALMVVYSGALLIRKRFIAAAVFALLAALMREIFAIYLIVLLGVAVVLWLKKRMSLRDVVASAAALGAFVAAYAAHYMIEAPYLGNVAVTEGTLGTILSVAARPLASRFSGPISYLMFPYGDAVFPAFLLALVAAVGLFLVLRDFEPARWALPGYLIAFLLFLGLIGASSSYWGQDISALSVIGCAVLLAGIDRLRKDASPLAAAPVRATGSRG
jgi:hypothetical protein